jgi:hypothetical protein
MSDSLTKRGQRATVARSTCTRTSRSSIGPSSLVSRDELEKAVDKVGNSGAAVRKQLAA